MRPDVRCNWRIRHSITVIDGPANDREPRFPTFAKSARLVKPRMSVKGSFPASVPAGSRRPLSAAHPLVIERPLLHGDESFARFLKRLEGLREPLSDVSARLNEKGDRSHAFSLSVVCGVLCESTTLGAGLPPKSENSFAPTGLPKRRLQP
jgi:hypothetical protein